MLDAAVGWRHGIVAEVARVPTTFADAPLANVAATLQPLATGSTAGGVSADVDDARTAAIAEAVERYAAIVSQLQTETDSAPVLGIEDFTLFDDAQRRDPAFPYASAYDTSAPLTRVYDVVDGSPTLVPVGLVTLDPARSVVATSSGLAADRSPVRALLRGVQELIERDALMVTWLHSVAARTVDVKSAYDVTCFDLTPAYSPHPVAAVAGNLPLRGRPRLSLGAACRARWQDAIDKAYAEWAQGAVFAGMRTGAADAEDVIDFDVHASYYSAHPDRWDALPIWGGPHVEPPPDADASIDHELHGLVTALAGNGVRVYYRDLTTIDSAAVGLRVVRSLSPDLVPIHANHRWPYIGGTARDLHRRYPWARPATTFPNPAPHPLG